MNCVADKLLIYFLEEARKPLDAVYLYCLYDGVLLLFLIFSCRFREGIFPLKCSGLPLALDRQRARLSFRDLVVT